MKKRVSYFMFKFSKEKSAKDFIKNQAEKAQKTFVAWTGGKDSTLVLWLVREALGESLPAVFLDSGVEFPEVYDFVEKWAREWDVEVYGERYEAENARQARENKIKALKKAQEKHGFDLLFVGIRRDEHPVRAKASKLERRGGIKRAHPILNWSEEEVWDFTKERGVPYCKLYDEGYRSLGEKPFTKKSKGSERSGRDQDKEAAMKRLRSLGYF